MVPTIHQLRRHVPPGARAAALRGLRVWRRTLDEVRAVADRGARARLAGRDHGALAQVLGTAMSTSGNPVHAAFTLRLLREAIAGKPIRGTVVEIGASPVPWLALALLMAGAERVHAVNVLDVTDTLDPAGVRVLATLVHLMVPGAAPASSFLRQDGGGCRLDPDRVVRHPHTDAAALDLPDGSVDLMLSFSVLEHVRALDAVLGRAAALTRPGGLGFHVIDLRDHRAMADPHAFRRLDEGAFASSYGADHNPRLWPAYVMAFQAAGFDILDAGHAGPFPVDPTGATDLIGIAAQPLAATWHASPSGITPWFGEADRAGLAVPWRDAPAVDLAVLGLNLLVRKPEV